MLRALSRPKVLIPLLLSGGLLAVVFSLADAPKVMGSIQGIPISVMVVCLLLAVAYLVLKGLQWHLFMEDLEIPIPWRQLALAYSVGEMTLSLPAGIYAQNYVLRRIAGADFSRSSAATTALLAVEATVCLIVLEILAIPGWDVMRTLILAFFALMAVVVAILTKVGAIRHWGIRLLHASPLGAVGPELLETFEGLGALFNLRTAARAVPLATVYLLALVTAFYLVAHAVGVTTLTSDQAVTVYLFALVIVLLSPFSSHLGIIEASGFGAMLAWGYDSTQALAALLGFRLVWTGAVWLVCGTVVLVLRDEFAAADTRTE